MLQAPCCALCHQSLPDACAPLLSAPLSCLVLAPAGGWRGDPSGSCGVWPAGGEPHSAQMLGELISLAVSSSFAHVLCKTRAGHHRVHQDMASTEAWSLLQSQANPVLLQWHQLLINSAPPQTGLMPQDHMLTAGPSSWCLAGGPCSVCSSDMQHNLPRLPCPACVTAVPRPPEVAQCPLPVPQPGFQSPASLRHAPAPLPGEMVGLTETLAARRRPFTPPCKQEGAGCLLLSVAALCCPSQPGLGGAGRQGCMLEAGSCPCCPDLMGPHVTPAGAGHSCWQGGCLHHLVGASHGPGGGH